MKFYISCIGSPKLFSLSCTAQYRARVIEHSIFHSESRILGLLFYAKSKGNSNVTTSPQMEKAKFLAVVCFVKTSLRDAH